MEDECDCGDPPPHFNIPPPPLPPQLPCELLDTMTCPSASNVGDAEFTRIGTFPSLPVIICSTLVSAVILLVIVGVVWRYFILKKRRKGGVTQSKDFDHHHHPHHLGPGPTTTMIPGNNNPLLYEDLAHARPRPPIATPSIEMSDVNHPHGTNGLGVGNAKLDFSYFLNPPPIYEELPDGGNSDNGPSEDEFAEDELSVIDVPINQCHGGGHEAGACGGGGAGESGGQPSSSSSSGGSHRYHPNSISSRNPNPKSRVQSLNRRRTSSRNTSTGPGTGPQSPGGFKPPSQRSLDRHGRNVQHGTPTRYPGTNPRPYAGGRSAMGISTDPSGSGMLILSDRSGMTMKIPPHLVAVLTESALRGVSGGRGYEVIPAGGLGHPGGPMHLHGGLINTSVLSQPNSGVYPSSRSSGSSYGGGDGSSSSSARINPTGNSVESSSFDSGIGPRSIASFANSPAYEQAVALSPQYPVPTSPYDYAHVPPPGGGIPTQFVTTQAQHPSFRRLRMQPSDRDHPLYSNHLL